MVRGYVKFIAAIYFVVGLYFLNASFNFLAIPFTEIVDSWVQLIGAVLLIISGFNYWKNKRGAF